MKENRAKVARRDPFTIRLLYDCKTRVQPVVLNVDVGEKIVALAASTEAGEIYATRVPLKMDAADSAPDYREFKKKRRNRKEKTRAAKPDIALRNKQICEKAIADVCKILPVKKIVIRNTNPAAGAAEAPGDCANCAQQKTSAKIL